MTYLAKYNRDGSYKDHSNKLKQNKIWHRLGIANDLPYMYVYKNISLLFQPDLSVPGKPIDLQPENITTNRLINKRDSQQFYLFTLLPYLVFV